MRRGFFFRFFCLLMAFVFVAAMRMVPVRYTTPPSPITVSEKVDETSNPRKRKGKN